MRHRRKIAISFLLITVVGVLFYLHRSMSEKEMVGKYVENDDGIPITEIELQPDGRFRGYADRSFTSGHWELQRWSLYGDDLILTSDNNGPGSYADQYLMTRKGGMVCIEADGDDGDRYWCKVSK